MPGEARLHLDWRTVPGETRQDVLNQLQPVLDRCLAEVEGSTGELFIDSWVLTTYPGRTETVEASLGSYLLDLDDALVVGAQNALTRAFSRQVGIEVWRFLTDACHLVEAGVSTIGFGACEAESIHTVHENVSLDMLAEGMLGYAALAMELTKDAGSVEA